jgi:hypothetical protein
MRRVLAAGFALHVTVLALPVRAATVHELVSTLSESARNGTPSLRSPRWNGEAFELCPGRKDRV